MRFFKKWLISQYVATMAIIVKETSESWRQYRIMIEYFCYCKDIFQTLNMLVFFFFHSDSLTNDESSRATLKDIERAGTSWFRHAPERAAAAERMAERGPM